MTSWTPRLSGSSTTPPIWTGRAPPPRYQQSGYDALPAIPLATCPSPGLNTFRENEVQVEHNLERFIVFKNHPLLFFTKRKFETTSCAVPLANIEPQWDRRIDDGKGLWSLL